MLGAYKARRGAVQRQLPLRRRGAAATCSTTPGAKAIVYHSAFAPTLAEVLPDAAARWHCCSRSPTASGNDLLPGAEWYEDALAAASARRAAGRASPDDLYILYTGGTTGMPKGVLWRQADIFVGAIGGRRHDGAACDGLDDVVAGGRRNGGCRGCCPRPPFMHGAGHWLALQRLHRRQHGLSSRTIPSGLDPDDVWRTIEREKVSFLLIVGDAFGRPLLDELDARARYDLSSLIMLLSGGAPLLDATQGAVPRASADR